MKERDGFWTSLSQGLASLKLTLFILLTLAAASLVGTLLPQGAAEEDLQSHYGQGMARLIEALGLQDLYHTNWFRFLLVLLCVSLIICTLERLPKTLKLLQRRDEALTWEKLLKFVYNRVITTRLPLDEAQTHLSWIMAEEFAPVRLKENGDGYGGVAEKRRWSRLMVYVVHLSVLLILLGALLGSVFGFKGYMTIPEGESSGEVALYRGDQSVTLPFQVRCDDFDASFYETGAPKEFRSDLVVIDKGKETVKRTIRVNDPLTYEGISFYQSSYGSSVKTADVEFTDGDSGKSYKMILPFREAVTIPGTNDKVELVQYQQNLGKFGPALGIALLKEGEKESSGSWILVEQPDFHGNKMRNYKIKPAAVEAVQYTGLQVKRDPGIWMVYIGFIAMIAGMGLTFYTSHRKLLVQACADGNCSRIVIAGLSSKGSFGFEQEFNGLCDRLQERLKSDERAKKTRT